MRRKTENSTLLLQHLNLHSSLYLYLPHNFMKMNECLQGPMKFYCGRKIFIEMVRVCVVAPNARAQK